MESNDRHVAEIQEYQKQPLKTSSKFHLYILDTFSLSMYTYTHINTYIHIHI